MIYCRVRLKRLAAAVQRLALKFLNIGAGSVKLCLMP